MVPQNQQMPNGWPLGLGNLTTTLLRDVESSEAAVPASGPTSVHVPSSSFSSFSSSNLDTESTASFFADHSVTLGRLIGINPMARGSLRSANGDETEQESDDIDEKELCMGICVPLLQNIIMVKTSKSRGTSRH